MCGEKDSKVVNGRERAGQGGDSYSAPVCAVYVALPYAHSVRLYVNAQSVLQISAAACEATSAPDRRERVSMHGLTEIGERNLAVGIASSKETVNASSLYLPISNKIHNNYQKASRPYGGVSGLVIP